MFIFPGFASFLLFTVHSCLISNHVTAQNAYCSICTSHTLCRYTSSSPPGRCTGYNVSGRLTQDDILTIVNKHNDLRERVATGQESLGGPGPQPPASDMKILTWDTELARIAQRLADQCTFGHDTCRNVARFPVGQNIAYLWNTKPTKQSLERAIEVWYNEVNLFDKNDVSRYRYRSSTSSYTQMVWANTAYIGCGRAYYFDTTMAYSVRLICNYGPAGNLIGQPIYPIGEAASACPSGVSNSSTNLCN